MSYLSRIASLCRFRRFHQKGGETVESECFLRSNNTMIKNTLEIFYDYICPFCYRGLHEFFELLPDYHHVHIDLCPCEVNPGAPLSAASSYRAIQLAYYLKSRNLNLKRYNDLIFEEYFENQGDINNIEVLMRFAKESGADLEDAASVFDNASYARKIQEANHLVWQKLRVPAVPAYRLGDIVQSSSGGLLISRAKLIALLELANAEKK